MAYIKCDPERGPDLRVAYLQCRQSIKFIGCQSLLFAKIERPCSAAQCPATLPPTTAVCCNIIITMRAKYINGEIAQISLARISLEAPCVRALRPLIDDYR